MAWSFAGRKNGTEHDPRIALAYVAKIEALIGQPGLVQPQLFDWWNETEKKYAKLRSTNTGSTSTRSLNRKTPSRKAGIGVSSAEPKASQPTFLNGNPGFRNAFLSCLGSLRVPKAGRLPLGKRPRRAARSRVTRSRHNGLLPRLRFARGVPSIYSVSPLRALDRPAWFAVVAGFNTGPLPKKIMGHEFFSTRT